MALRLLAGPFTVADATGWSSSLWSLWWYEGVGLVAHGDSTYRDMIISLDGRIELIGNGDIYSYFAYWSDRKRLLEVRGMDEKVKEPKALMYSGVLSGVLSADLQSSSYVRIGDKRYYLQYAYVYSMKDGVLTQESEALPFGGVVRQGRGFNEIMIVDAAGGRFCFYDVVRKNVSPVYYLGMAVTSIVYVPEWNIVVSYKYPYELRIWGLEVMPASISAPILVSGLARQGYVATYRTQVLGAQSDPCAGELVDWSLEGNSELIDMQTATDEEGYAVARVGHRFTDSGDVVVKVSLRC